LVQSRARFGRQWGTCWLAASFQGSAIHGRGRIFGGVGCQNQPNDLDEPAAQINQVNRFASPNTTLIALSSVKLRPLHYRHAHYLGYPVLIEIGLCRPILPSATRSLHGSLPATRPGETPR
jgi:hypothetical protein